MTDKEVVSDLVNVLFHAETIAFESKQERSFEVFKKECTTAAAQHKYRLGKAKKNYVGAINLYKSLTPSLKKVFKELTKRNFEIASAELVKTNFKLNLKKEGDDFPAYLKINSAKEEIALEIFKCSGKRDTKLLEILYSKKQVVVKDTELPALLNAIEHIAVDKEEVDYAEEEDEETR